MRQITRPPRLSPEEKETIANLFLSRKNVNEIMEATGRSAPAINRVLLPLRPCFLQSLENDSKLIHLLRAVEKAFDLPMGTMTRRHPSGKLPKVYREVNLSDIRRAVAYHLSIKYSPKEIYGLLQTDHTSYIVQMRSATAFVKNNDKTFFEYLKKVQEAIPIEAPETILYFGQPYQKMVV